MHLVHVALFMHVRQGDTHGTHILLVTSVYWYILQTLTHRLLALSYRYYHVCMVSVSAKQVAHADELVDRQVLQGSAHAALQAVRLAYAIT